MKFITTCLFLSVLFPILKLSGVIRWKWRWVFAPLYVLIAVVAIVGFIAGRIEV